MVQVKTSAGSTMISTFDGSPLELVLVKEAVFSAKYGTQHRNLMPKARLQRRAATLRN